MARRFSKFGIKFSDYSFSQVEFSFSPERRLDVSPKTAGMRTHVHGIFWCPDTTYLDFKFISKSSGGPNSQSFDILLCVELRAKQLKLRQ